MVECQEEAGRRMKIRKWSAKAKPPSVEPADQDMARLCVSLCHVKAEQERELWRLWALADPRKEA